MFNSLFSKLSLVFLLTVVVLGSVLLLLAEIVSDRYSQEVMQHLNREVAPYITQQAPLLDDNLQVRSDVLDRLAHHAMVLNPSLEIYVLDLQGVILGHRLPPETVKLQRVDLAPIQQYLQTEKFPVLGADPRQPDKPNVFSVAPIVQHGQTVGYVYAIVGGQLYQQLRQTTFGSYSLQMGIALTLVSVIAASLLGCLVFFVMTRRLSELRRRVLAFNLRYPQDNALTVFTESMSKQPQSDRVDEIDQLMISFQQMASHICEQYEALKRHDETRRELIANVSHDLRTPLASMQGYIETVLIKYRELDEHEREQYLRVAIQHCQRLSGLIDELFELSRLESGHVQPKPEPFSLLELMHDCVQEFRLRAQQGDVQLQVANDSPDCYVVADIGMIQRVLQNLIDNAITHTPAGGQISLSLHQVQTGVRVAIQDSGRGISSHEIPHIFDRYYRAQQQQASDDIGSGLGLAIVKRILDLHQASMDVKSAPEQGTVFSFVLPVS